MKQKITLLFLLLLSQLINVTRSSASHIFGGDIAYVCLGNNQFQFTFTLYQDCLTGEPQAIAEDLPLRYAIYAVGSDALITTGQSGEVIEQFIVPTGFSNDCVNNIPNTCMQKTVVRFTVQLPPTNLGYVFVYQRCCRNQFINNIYSPGVTGATYTSYIPPFPDNVCTNNSAVFDNNPPQIICANQPFEFDFSATDVDGDSLSYELCTAYIGGSQTNPVPIGPAIQGPPHTPVSYVPPYSAQYPIPSSPAFAINPVTGILTGTPTALGRYVFSVCVKEWRNGQVINTLTRDLQYVITDCSKAVVANIPSLTHEPDVYVARCDSIFTVPFINNSTGGFEYFWDFGDPNTNADTSTLFQPSYTYPDTGTYIVKLVVNRSSTCADSITRKVKIYPKFEVDFQIEGQYCMGEPINLSDRSIATFPEIFGWEWNFGDGNTSNEQNPVHRYNSRYDEFWVQLIAKTTRGCIDTARKKIVIPYFRPFAGNDTTVIKNTTFNMNGSGGILYQWTPVNNLANPNDPKSSVSFDQEGVYRYNLNVESQEGCVGNDSVRITVASRPYFIVPTVFSPNGDGLNDVIRPLSAGYPNLSVFMIYNRWGQQVFNMFTSNSGGWDGTFNGKPADVGVYFWYARATNMEGVEEEFQGDITLIR